MISSRWRRGPRRVLLAIALLLLPVVAVAIGLGWWQAGQFETRFDAEYVGSEQCGTCHRIMHGQWQTSPHANMVRFPDEGSVVGDFAEGEFRLPADSPDPLAGQVVARTFQQDGRYYMALRHPERPEFVGFPINRVIGYQYRQEYLVREPGGVLRRLPLQWSTARNEFFPYWNLQEKSDQTLSDLWAQMTSQNSAWNLYCARCHVTNLNIIDRDEDHTRAEVSWQEHGIGCEACHGPGSRHVAYMESSPVNRLAMFARNHLRDQPVAYVANADKLPKGQAMSVCARCHGADIFSAHQDIYRVYEPGYSRSGRVNDLSEYFQRAPLTPGRTAPTIEVWANGRPKGIGMLFRSLIESTCYQEDEVRCYDCHDPHQNKAEAEPGILNASATSNAYCSQCHEGIAEQLDAHTRHAAGEPGSFCYDCHMPSHITKLNTGIWQRARTHEMSSLPNPDDSLRFGLDQAPNACSDCHADIEPARLVEIMNDWWPGALETSVAPPDEATF